MLTSLHGVADDQIAVFVPLSTAPFLDFNLSPTCLLLQECCLPSAVPDSA